MNRPHAERALPWLLVALSGCAVPLSGFEPAHVTPKGQFRVEAGADVSIPTGAIIDTIDTAKSLSSQAAQRDLTPVEQRRLFEAGVNLAYNPPALLTHVGIAYGLPHDFEVGLRMAAGGYWKGGIRRQFLRQAEHRFDFSIGLGLSRAKTEFPISDQVKFLKMDDYTRWAVEIPAMFGKHSDIYRVWFGPRAVLWKMDTALHLDLPANTGGSGPSTVLATAEGTGMLLGAQAGLALGYRKVFIGFELTLAQSFGTAKLSASGESTNVGLGSFIVYPALALMGEF